MVGDMENYKVLVNNEAESREVQDLFFELGGDFYFGGKFHCNTHLNLVTINKDGLMANLELDGFDYVEITIHQLRDLVVLKRNSIDDASFKDAFGDIWYVDSTNNYWMFENGVWREAEKPLFKLEPIKKPIENEVRMKEYLEPSNSYSLIKAHRKEGNDWIEVPEGAEEYRANYKFYKNNGELFYSSSSEWTKSSIMPKYITLWQRNPETYNTSTQDKLKFIEKWLNGEKIQYILGDMSEKTQWHNFTEGAMQYIKRSDIKFREAPKYVTINGIEFKSVKSLLNHVKNNFDLEDGE